MHYHEEWIDGKLYLDEIRSCSCDTKIGSEYELSCRIHRRGTNTYYCEKKADCIMREGRSGRKSLYLKESAKAPVKIAIRRFENGVDGVKKDGELSVSLMGGNVTVTIKRRSKKAFDAVMECAYSQADFNQTTRLLKKESIGEIIIKTARAIYCNYNEKELYDLLYNTSADTLKDNPFYCAAMNSDDELLKIQIRHFYNLSSKEDLRRLGKIFRRRILPALDKEFDRVYTVPAKEIDFGLLFWSGYQFVHRPYFAMYECSHDLYELNPHTRRGVDAGKYDIEPTSFEDFLKLFNNKPENKKEK